MKRKIWLAVIMTLVLGLCLAISPALADGEEPTLENFNVWIDRNTVDPGQDMIIKFRQPNTSDGQYPETDYTYLLCLQGVDDDTPLFYGNVEDNNEEIEFKSNGGGENWCVIPETKLTKGKTYRATVTASAARTGINDEQINYQTVSKFVYFTATKTGYGIYLDIDNWEPNPDEGVNVRMNVWGEGLDCVELFDQNGFHRKWWNNYNPRCLYTKPDVMNTVLYARARFIDEDENEIWVTSNVCDFDFAYRLVDFDIQLSDYLANQNNPESISITVNPANKSDNMAETVDFNGPYLRCRSNDEENVQLNNSLSVGQNVDGNVVYTLPTANLTPGNEYEVWATTSADGYYSNYCYRRFFIRNNAYDEITVAVDNTAHFIHDKIHFSFTGVEYAKEVKLNINGDEEEVWYDDENTSWSRDLTIDEKGTFTVFAMARFEGENNDYWVSSNTLSINVVPQLEGLELHIHDQYELDDDLDFRFEPAALSDGSNAKVTHTLSITCLDDSTITVDTEGVRLINNCFVVPASILTAGHYYRATITATTPGDYAPVSDSCEFLARQSSESFGAWIHADNEHINTNQEVRIHAWTSDQPEWLELWYGQECKYHWDKDELDNNGEVEWWDSWENETSTTMYVRAEFKDRFNSNAPVLVTSEACTVTVHQNEDSKALEDAKFTISPPFAAQGTPITVTVTPIANTNAWVAVEVTNSEETQQLYYHEFYPDDVVIPTAEIPEGTHKLFVWWKAWGYPVTSHGTPKAIQIHAYPNNADAFIHVTGPDKNGYIAPRTEYAVEAIDPNAERVCIYEGWEICQKSETNRILFYDESDRVEDRTYYLGIGVENEDHSWTWTRSTTESVTVHITSEKKLPKLYPELQMSNDNGTYWIDTENSIFENQLAGIKLPMLAWANEPEGYDPQDVDYCIEIHDCNDGYREVWRDDFRLYPIEGHDNQGHDGTYLEGCYDADLRVGHEYELVARAWYSDYPVQEASLRFLVLPQPNEGSLTLSIEKVSGEEPEDPLADFAVDTNEELKITVVTPEGVKAVQIFWDGEWRGPDRKWKPEGESTTWTWTDSLGSDGEQRIVARATRDDANNDEWDRWNEDDWSNNRNWQIYSDVVPVSVNDAVQVELPSFAIKNENRTVIRGENLMVSVEVCKKDENISRYELFIMGMDENGDYWNHIQDLTVDCLDPGVEHDYTINTATLEPGTYRLMLRCHAGQGAMDNESEYENPNYYFTVTETNAQYGITVTGDNVQQVSEDGVLPVVYSVPTCSDYTVSGFVIGADEICVFELEKDDENEDNVRDERSADSFSWTYNEGRRTEYCYILGVWNDREDKWEKLTEQGGAEEAQVVIQVIADEGNDLGETKITAPTTVAINEDNGRIEDSYSFTFTPVEGAQNYDVELFVDRVDDNNYHKHFYNESFSMKWHTEPGDEDGTYIVNPDSLPSGITYVQDEQGHYVFQVNMSLPRYSEEYDGDLPNYIDQECVIAVNVTRDGWNGSRAEKRFRTVPKTAKLGISLTQIESPGIDTFYVNRTVSITITGLRGKPDELEYYWEGNDWRGFDLNRDNYWNKNVQPDGSITIKDCFSNPGEQPVMVRARYGEQWDYSPTQDVKFDARENYELELPEVEISNDQNQVGYGKALIVLIGGIDEDEFYHLKALNACYRFEVYDAEGDETWRERYSQECEPGKTQFDLNTTALAGGKYRLRFKIQLPEEALEEGWYCPSSDEAQENDADLRFTVNTGDTELQPLISISVDGITLIPNGENRVIVPLHQEYDIEAVIPGWNDGICIFRDNQTNPRWEEEGSYCRSSDRQDDWDENEDNIYTYTVGYWDYVQEEWISTGVSINVYQDYCGKLKDPVIEAAELFETKANAKYSFTVTSPVKDTEEHDIDITPEATVECWKESRENDKPVWDSHSWGEQSIDANFESGEYYKIKVWADALGYDGSYSEWRFYAMDSANEDLVLTIIGDDDVVIEPDDDGVIYVTANDNFKIDLTGAQVNEDVELYWDDEWRGQNLAEFPLGGSRDVGVYSLAARAKVQDGQADWRYSNTVTLRAELTGENGQIPMPELELSEIDQDGLMYLTITGVDSAVKQCTESYNICVTNRENGHNYWPEDSNIRANNINTANGKEITINPNELSLRPGMYRVHVHAQAKPGWANNWTDENDKSLWFYIPMTTFGIQTEEESGWSDLSENHVNAVPNQTVRIAVDIPEVGRYGIMENDDTDWCDENWRYEGNDVFLYVGRGDVGEYSFTLCRWVEQEDGGYWQPIKDKTVSMTVSAEEGKDPLGEIAINVGKTISFTNNGCIEFSFDEVDGAEGYNISVYNNDQRIDMFGDGGICYEANAEGWTKDDTEEGAYIFNYTDDKDKNYNASIKYENESSAYTVRVPFAGANGKSRVADGDLIRIDVSANAYGVNSSHDTCEVLVAKEAKNIALTVNDEQDVLDAEAGQNLKFNISIETEQSEFAYNRVQFWWDNEWRDFGTHDGGYWAFDDGFDYDFSNVTFYDWRDSGDYIFQVRAGMFDDQGNGDWEYSNAVKVTVEGKDMMPPTVALRNLDDNGQLPRGRQLGVLFLYTPTGADTYHVRIRDAENDEQMFFQEYPAKDSKILLPSNNLQKNREYYVEIWVEPKVGFNSVGIEDNDGLHFTVTTGDPSFNADKKTAWTQERITLSGYVPGAEGLRIEYEGENGEKDGYENGGNNISWECSLDYAGTYRFSLLQWVNDDWALVTYMDSGSNKLTSDPISVKVKANRNLTSPVIDAYTDTNDSVTSTLEAGNDLTFKVTTDEKVDSDHLSLKVCDEDSNDPEIEKYHLDNTTTRTFTISAGDLVEGHTYRIEAYTWQEQYNSSDAKFRFTVVSGNEDEIPTMTMKIEGKDNASIELSASRDYEIAFTINQPKETDPDEPITPEEIQIRWDNEWRNVGPEGSRSWQEYEGYSWLKGSFTMQDGSITRNLIMRSRFRFDDGNPNTDDNVWVYSNSILLTLVSEGQVNQPVLSNIIGIDEDGNIARNKNLTFNISLPGKDGQDDRTGVHMLRVVLYSDENFEKSYDDYSVELSANATTGTLPAANLEEGREFRLALRAEALEGWDSNESEYDNDLIFRVVGTEENAEATLTASKETVSIQEGFTISGYIPDVNGIALFCDGECNAHWDGDSFISNQGFLESGEHIYTLGVWNNYINDWKELSGNDYPSVKVTVQPGEPLQKATITSSNPVKDDENGFTFEVSEVENATEYYIGLHDKNDNVLNNTKDNRKDARYTPDKFEGGKLVISIPATVFRKYQENDQFTIHVTACAPGYESSFVSKSIVMIPAPATGGGLTLKASKETAEVNTDITFTLTHSGGYTVAQINTGNEQWMVMDPVNNEEFTYAWAAPDAGQYTISARAKNGDEGDWDYSGPIEASYTASGSIPDFTIAIDNSKPRQGDNVTVTISMGANADRSGIHHFDVSIMGTDRGNYEEIYGEKTLDDGNATSFILSTSNLEPNTSYRINIGAIGNKGVPDKWINSDDLGVHFTVKERLEYNATLTASNTTVMVGEKYDIIANVPGAASIELYMTGKEEPCGSTNSDTLEVNNLMMTEAGSITYSLEAKDEIGHEIDLPDTSITVTSHDWYADSVTYVLDRENKTVTATRTCSEHGDGCNVDGHTQTEIAEATFVETTAATCETPGEGKWYASFKNEAFGDWSSENDEESPALGHDWGKVVYSDWEQAGNDWKITATRTCGRDDCNKKETETAFAVPQITIQESCEKVGERTWTATFENEAFEEKTRTDEIPALEHDWEHGESSYEWSDDYKKVTATRTCKNGCGETITEIADATVDVDNEDNKPATCEEDGKQVWVSDPFVEHSEWFEAQTATETLEKLDHDLVITYKWNSDPEKGWTVTASYICKHDGKCSGENGAPITKEETVDAKFEVIQPATCVAKGIGAWTATFEDGAFEKQTGDKEEIPVNPAAHALTAHAAVAATCTVPGNNAYWTCDRCGKVFADKDGKTETTVAAQTIAALGHDWNAPTYVWAEDNSKVTATRTCKHDASHPETETVNTTYAVTTPAAVGVEGVGTYTATFTNAAFAPQTKTVAIPALTMYTVTFDSDGGSPVEPQIVAEGGKATKPVDPTKAAYTFAGWFLGESVTAFDFDNTPITSNITLKAKWNVSTTEVDAVIALINSLPNPAGVADKAAVEAARAAYNALTDAQRALISSEILQKLADAEKQVKDAEEEASKPSTGPMTVGDGNYNVAANGTAVYTGPAGDPATVTIPDTITVNGKPVKVTSIADKAFFKKAKLKTITIGKNIETIGKSAFESCKSLTTIKGGKGVVTIKDKAFASCAKLKKIPAFEKLQTIGASAFKGDKVLASLTLSANVNKIGKDAFNGCAALKKITIKTTKLTDKNVGKNAFKGINSKATFKCPKGKAKDYKKILQKKGAPKTAKFK